MSLSQPDDMLPSAMVLMVQQLAVCQDLPAILTILRNNIRSLVGADGMTVVLRRGEYCHYVEEQAIGPLWKGQQFPMEACISGWVMLQRSSTIIEDIYTDPRIPLAAYEPTFVRSLAMVPIRQADPIGAIGCYWASRYRCSTEQLGLLQDLADSTAIAMMNVQLITELTLAKQRAERDAELRDQFVTLVAHELRTPLTTLLGTAQLLQRDLQSLPISAKAQQRSAVMLDELNRLHALVEHLLLVPPAHAGTLMLRWEDRDLGELVRSCLDTCASNLVRHHITLDLPTSPCWITADAEYLMVAIRNLVENAIRYTPEGGHLRIHMVPEAEVVHLQISDTGRGIPQDELPHIFDRFYRARNVNLGQTPGVGIGLAIVKLVVGLHGGHVVVKSQEGQGSTFTIILPRRSWHEAVVAVGAIEEPSPIEQI